MPRYIDADAFWKAMTTRFDSCADLGEISDVLDLMPTISPGEVRCVGKWERYEKENPNARRCSRCKNCYVNADQPKSLWKFCPECGAHMEVRE